MRLVQMILAVGGMVLVLHYGVERTPPWGEATGLPVHWNLHLMPFSIGMILIALAMALIWAKDRA